MDLRHDWKTLNEVLFESMAVDMSQRSSAVVLVEDQGQVVDGILSSGSVFEDHGFELNPVTHEKLDQISKKYGVEQAVVISKKNLDAAVSDASFMGSNYYQQLASIREEIVAPLGKLKTRAQTQLVVSRKHFLLDFFASPVKKLLPRKFNVLLFIDQRSSPKMISEFSGPFSHKSVLLTYTKGVLDEFYEPDFSSLHDNRLTNWTLESGAIGQYLVSRYILPCYAFFMYKDDWEKCRQSKGLTAWDIFIASMEQGNARIYPENRLMRFLVLGYRIYSFFKRKISK